MAHLGIINVRYKLHGSSSKPSDDLTTSWHHFYPEKSYSNCMSLPQTPYLLTSGTCNPNFPLVSLDHTVRVTQRYLHFHRDLVLTGCGLTQRSGSDWMWIDITLLWGSVFPGFYLHSSLSWQKKSPLEVPWGTGIDITRETQICFLRYIVGPWTNNCNLIPLSVVPSSEKRRWVGCYQKPFT